MVDPLLTKLTGAQKRLPFEPAAPLHLIKISQWCPLSPAGGERDVAAVVAAARHQRVRQLYHAGVAAHSRLCKNSLHQMSLHLRVCTGRDNTNSIRQMDDGNVINLHTVTNYIIHPAGTRTTTNNTANNNGIKNSGTARASRRGTAPTMEARHSKERFILFPPPLWEVWP